jgi:acyl-CoA hydrolase
VADLDIAQYLRPGDTVLIGQAAAEPPALVEKFIEAAHAIGGLTAFCGYTLSDAWADVSPGQPNIKAYAAHGALRKLSAKGLVDIVPCHYREIEDLITTGHIRVDAVLIQVAPADTDGYYSLGATVDYAAVAAEQARVVLVEVNANMPRTSSSRSLHLPRDLCTFLAISAPSSRSLHRSRVAASVTTSRALADSPVRPATSAERAVAENVAVFVPSGATIQLGVGALADAIARELRGRRDLRVRSGLVGDWLVDLDEAGALADSPGSCVTGIALGTDRLYKFLNDSAKVRMAPVDEQLAPAALAQCDPYVAMNSAIEVDLHGQVSAEVVGGRYVGAVGGQVGFFRAARQARSGLAIVPLAATNADGTASRIVPAVSGPVTTPQSDVDLVITEFGAADLRGTSYRERAERLIAVAAPQHRAILASGRPPWL